MGMTVERVVNKAIEPVLFDMLLRCLDHINQQYGLSGREAVAPIMKQLYNVTISELTKWDNGINGHLVRFESEQDYAWFVLRWA